MKKAAHSSLRISAVEFLRNLDQFAIKGELKEQENSNAPFIIKTPLFSGRTAKSKLANAVTTIPLRIVRKSTMDYHLYQSQLNAELQLEIDVLHKRIDAIEYQNQADKK